MYKTVLNDLPYCPIISEILKIIHNSATFFLSASDLFPHAGLLERESNLLVEKSFPCQDETPQGKCNFGSTQKDTTKHSTS